MGPKPMDGMCERSKSPPGFRSLMTVDTPVPTLAGELLLF